MAIFGFNGVNGTPDDGNKVRKGNDGAGKKPKTIDEQIEDINKQIQEQRDRLNINTTPEEFAEIQKEISTLQEKRYHLLARKS